MPRKPKLHQAVLTFPKGRGGPRHRSGRKPNGAKAGIPHETRTPLSSRHPAHVTVRLLAGLPNLRNKQTYGVLRRAFAAGCDRFGFRLCEYSVQGNHMHLIVEAKDRRALSRGMQGLLIRVAKALNKLWQRRGTVFADRYHDRVIKTPRHLRNVLNYVLNNARRHRRSVNTIDYYTSGPWFKGWRETVDVTGLPPETPIATAHTWLLNVGWRKRGLISIAETPRAP